MWLIARCLPWHFLHVTFKPEPGSPYRAASCVNALCPSPCCCWCWVTSLPMVFKCIDISSLLYSPFIWFDARKRKKKEVKELNCHLRIESLDLRWKRAAALLGNKIVFSVLCFTVTRSSIPGNRLVGMGGEGKYKQQCIHTHIYTHTDPLVHDCLDSIANILSHLDWNKLRVRRAEIMLCRIRSTVFCNS